MMQHAFNTFIMAAVFSLMAISFGLLFKTVRFFHIALGTGVVIGSYAGYALTQKLNLMSLPLLGLAGLVGVVVAALYGVLSDLAVFKPLRRRGATPLVLLVASLGIYVILQNTISALFGDDLKTLRTWPVREGIAIFDARITPAQIVIIAAAVVLFAATVLILRYTRAGIAMRALASNAELATVSGMDTDRVILYVFMVSSALAGAAGILVSLDVDMTPTMGLNALLMGVVAAIIGGIGSIPGAALGALLLATAQQVAVIWLPSQWQDAIAFGILLLFLVFRPQGIFGGRIAKASI